ARWRAFAQRRVPPSSIALQLSGELRRGSVTMKSEFSEHKPGKGLTKFLSRSSRSRRKALKAEVDLSVVVSGKRRNDLSPRLTVTVRELERLRPATRRVRTTEPEHLARVARSIATYGFAVPIFISAE